MDGVDVVAQPGARVGEPQPGRRDELGRGAAASGPASRRLDRLGRARGSPTARTAAARRSSPRRARGRGCRRAPAPRPRARARAPASARNGRGELGRVAMRRPRAARARRRGSRAGRRRASASISGARSSARRSRSLPLAAPRCRSEMTSVRTRTSVPRRWRPLDGILVADFSRVLAGPLAAMLLGDLGADVIKVERPDGGDDTRAWGPPWRERRRDLLPRAQPQQALARARPRRPRATSSSRAGSPAAPTC